MDLKEVTDNLQTHPWETARVRTLETILKKFTIRPGRWRVLDVGCGNAFVTTRLFRKFKTKIVEGVDIALADEQINEFTSRNKHVVIHNSFNNLIEKKYNLILLLDVLEHLKDDVDFVNSICTNYLAPGGYLLVTVPAYQSFYSTHDAFLGHYRRYSPNRLIYTINSIGLSCERWGQLFSSLLPIRGVMLLYERFIRKRVNTSKGLGNWRWGNFITRFAEIFLTTENRLLLDLCTKNIRLPGLSVWALYRKL